MSKKKKRKNASHFKEPVRDKQKKEIDIQDRADVPAEERKQEEVGMPENINIQEEMVNQNEVELLEGINNQEGSSILKETDNENETTNFEKADIQEEISSQGGIDKQTEIESIFQDVSKTLNSEDKTVDSDGSKETKKRKKHIVLKLFLITIFIGIVGLAIYFVRGMNENGWSMKGLVATILGHDSNTVSNLPRVNILVIGQSQNLTDTLLVCTYDPKTQDLGMLSIPRDTFVGKNKNRASASDKINALYQTDPNKLLEKVNDITGLGIKYYIKVDTKGFRDLVDSIGGIYFNVPVDMDYDDVTQDLHIHMKAGYQLLDGDKAEQVVRFRHNNDGTSYSMEYGEQDLGRMRTQRAFITEVIRQVAKMENLTKIDDFIKIANENVETNFDLWNLKDYAPYILEVDIGNINTAALPGVPEKINELWFFAYDEKESEKVIREVFKNELTEEQQKNSEIKVNVLNGSNSSANLEIVENLLTENGFTVIPGYETTNTQATTIINRTGENENIADQIQEIVGTGTISNAVGNDSEVDFTVIIGDDF